MELESEVDERMEFMNDLNVLFIRVKRSYTKYET